MSNLNQFLSKGAKAAGAAFHIPAGPSSGTSVTTSATTDTYGNYVQLIASTSAALYIVGVCLTASSSQSNSSYAQVMLGTGAASSETNVGELSTTLISDGGSSIQGGGYVPIWPPIPVAASTRIAAKAAATTVSSNVVTVKVKLYCINQADVVAM